MANKKQILCGILACTTALSMAGCGEKKQTDSGNGDITIKWVVPGPGKQTDSAEVWQKANELLKTYEGMENVSIDLDVIPASDYKQKVMLMQTSGNDVDIFGTYTLDFNEEVKNGTFLDITDMMKTYAPDVLNEMPEWALQLMQVDGKQYCITNYQQMSQPMWGYTFNKEDADKFLDAEALKKEALSSDILTKGTLDIFEKYMEDLKSAGKFHLGMRPGSTWAMKGYVPIVSNYLYRAEADKIVVEERLELDSLKMLTEVFHDWFKKGYIRKDVLSAEVSKGDYDIWHSQYHKYAEESLSKTSDKPVTLVQSENHFYIPTSANAGGNGITATSKNPEKALSFLNLMCSSKGKDLYRMLVYGIENKNYKKISEDRIEPIGYTGSQGSADAPYGLWKWTMGNTANSFESTSDPEGWNDYVFNDWNKNAVPSPIAGIYIDTTPIETELSQCNSVCGEFIDQLTSGAMTDWKATYEEAMRKLEIAGNKKVKEYIQKCVDDFLATKK